MKYNKDFLLLIRYLKEHNLIEKYCNEIMYIHKTNNYIDELYRFLCNTAPFLYIKSAFSWDGQYSLWYRVHNEFLTMLSFVHQTNMFLIDSRAIIDDSLYKIYCKIYGE